VKRILGLQLYQGPLALVHIGFRCANKKEVFLAERLIEWAAQATWAASHGKSSHGQNLKCRCCRLLYMKPNLGQKGKATCIWCREELGCKPNFKNWAAWKVRLQLAKQT